MSAGTLDLSAQDDPRPDAPAPDDYGLPGGDSRLFAGEPEGLPADVAEAPEVDEATVRQWLDLAGLGLNWTLPGRNYGVADAWRMTQRDLDEIAPPATRILNRHPWLRAVATRADVDAFTLAAAVAGYGFRNGVEVLQARKDAEAERPHMGGREAAEPETPAGPSWPGFTGSPTR
jgi:hypothetical protein